MTAPCGLFWVQILERRRGLLTVVFTSGAKQIVVGINITHQV